MRSISGNLNASLTSATTTLCKCWQLQRRDGTAFRFTDHDVPVVFGGATYEPFLGFSASAIEGNTNLQADNLEVTVLIDHDTITEADLAGGLWDGATVDIWLVDWMHPEYGGILLAGGWMVGEIKRVRGQFSAELRSKAARLEQRIGKTYSATCRANMGDARCGLNKATYSVSGTVTASSDQAAFTDTSRAEPDGYFRYGLLTWTGGDNTGRSVEIKTHAAGAITLFEAMPNLIRTGDTYSLVAGCDKKLSTCRTRFNNAVNFRGEPFVPGADAISQVILKADGTRSASNAE